MGFEVQRQRRQTLGEYLDEAKADKNNQAVWDAKGWNRLHGDGKAKTKGALSLLRHSSAFPQYHLMFASSDSFLPITSAGYGGSVYFKHHESVDPKQGDSDLPPGSVPTPDIDMLDVIASEPVSQQPGTELPQAQVDPRTSEGKLGGPEGQGEGIATQGEGKGSGGAGLLGGGGGGSLKTNECIQEKDKPT
ncbi:unnamed protein product [Rhizoctonia solani]|uniref:Uncharacterized protein n=1 Tax=Rhizoctonia solani TaxID=456999 RepID=A0A8H3CN55_9AGAM|nr:unnamed protein product [Rhizoctonia solani]